MEKKTDFKALSNKAKVQYIWDYYKLHILFGGVIAAIVIGLGYHFITYRKPVLSVIMINVQTTSENAEAAFDEFSDATGYDKKQQPIDVSANLQFSDDPNATTDYNDYMVLSTMIGAGGIFSTIRNSVLQPQLFNIDTIMENMSKVLTCLETLTDQSTENF